MYHLENAQLRVDLLDPVLDATRLGARYCHGGYIWQVHDAELGPLVSGPEYPGATPSPFNGQGLPESFRHRTREGTPLTWEGTRGVAIGAGTLSLGDNDAVLLAAPCEWQIASTAAGMKFRTGQSLGPLSYNLVRTVELFDRTIVSSTELTNVGGATLALQWFAHPFWPLVRGRAEVTLPAGASVTDNPGFEVTDGMLRFRRPFVTDSDQQFAVLQLPADRELSVAVNHPKLTRVRFTSSFFPSECPVWANARTISVEPYLSLNLARGESRTWHVRHIFEH
jgi:hypothetical protein